MLLEETFHQLIDPDSIYSCGMWILLNTAGNLIITQYGSTGLPWVVQYYSHT